MNTKLWKNEWKHKGKVIPIGMQLALSEDEQVLYGQTHQNQSGLDTTGQYFVFRRKDSDGRFTSEIDYANYRQVHNQLDAWDSATLEGWHHAVGEVGDIDNDFDCGKILLKMATSKTSNPKSQKTGGTPIQSLGWTLKNDDGEILDIWVQGYLLMQSKAITIMQNWMQLNSSIAFRKRLKLKLARLIH